MSPRRPKPRLVLSWLMRICTCAALAVDAYVHANLAHRYDPNNLATLSQGDLFRIEAAVAALAALTLILTARRIAWILAITVAASALAAILVYRYHDIGPLGPLPDMYEPSWYPQKTLTALAEAGATMTALTGLIAVNTTRYPTRAAGVRRRGGGAGSRRRRFPPRPRLPGRPGRSME